MVRSHNKPMFQIEFESLRLDFFSRQTEDTPVKGSQVKLVDAEADTARFNLPCDVRSYVQCDCACK